MVARQILRELIQIAEADDDVSLAEIQDTCITYRVCPKCLSRLKVQDGPGAIPEEILVEYIWCTNCDFDVHL